MEREASVTDGICVSVPLMDTRIAAVVEGEVVVVAFVLIEREE